MVDSRGRMVRAVGMTQTYLSPAQVDELVALYEAGATLVELGERFGVHHRTAAAHLVRRSVPIRRRGLNEHHLAEAVELYTSGLTLLEVGHDWKVKMVDVALATSAAPTVARQKRHAPTGSGAAKPTMKDYPAESVSMPLYRLTRGRDSTDRRADCVTGTG